MELLSQMTTNQQTEWLTANEAAEPPASHALYCYGHDRVKFPLTGCPAFNAASGDSIERN